MQPYKRLQAPESAFVIQSVAKKLQQDTLLGLTVLFALARCAKFPHFTALQLVEHAWHMRIDACYVETNYS